MNNGLKNSLSWGGLTVVVFFVDDVQLVTPVCDFPVYICEFRSPAAMHGSLIRQEINTVVTLKAMVRQDKFQLI